MSALLLALTFTNLPKYITQHKLLILPLSMLLALIILLGIVCIYTKGNWFFVSTISIILGVSVIFTPIYISKYKFFSKIKKYNEFVSIFIDFVILNILLIVVNLFTISNGYSKDYWYFSIALPITLAIYIILNVLICVRFLRVNKLIKTSIILFLINLFMYIPPLFVKVKNPLLQREINDINIFKANFAIWTETTIDQNVHCIVFFTILVLTITFFTIGLRSYLKKIKIKGRLFF